MKTKDKWVEETELALGGILLKGFSTKETDSAMLFRIQCMCVNNLRDHLRRIYDELTGAEKAQTPATLPLKAKTS